MKKVLLSAALLGGILFGANAQIEIGPKIGLNIGSAAYSEGDVDGQKYEAAWEGDGNSKKTFLGLQLGLSINAPISEAISIRPEVLFSQKGIKVEQKNDDYTAVYTNKVNYLEVPVNVSYGLPIGDNKLELFAGPYVAFAMGGKFSSDVDKDDFKEDNEYNYSVTGKKIPKDGREKETAYVNSMDAGINLGVGFRVSSILIAAQYSLGLSNTGANYEDSDLQDDRVNDEVYKNRVLSFSLTYYFGGE